MFNATRLFFDGIGMPVLQIPNLGALKLHGDRADPKNWS